MASLLYFAPWILACTVLTIAFITILTFSLGWRRLASEHSFDPRRRIRGIKIDSSPVSVGWGSLPGLPALSCNVIITEEGFILRKRFVLRSLCPEIFARWQDIAEIRMLDDLPELGVAVKLHDKWPVLYLNGAAASKIWRAC